ncbi:MULTISPECIES: anaerobic ribonucleoside-triphosphate reductase [Burkholderia]|uniref:anaerobic ribonucleoside-triphosphate reductase n=1 Tax=Burkholderia TaxID=32008 RepID=UPI001CF35204|nr:MULTISPECIES: anaerobic ribonucleoside-triphosphate reductase [Burkholderia]MCA8037238.1 anaerobic ribonucleoside-triphosphate reductase [Burkholderia arboris]MDN7702651.1 anaerobic ribonucleoside-triphosphate reductase [Burkholderia sp. AU44665]
MLARPDTTQQPTERAHAAALPNHERTRCEIWTRVMGYHRPVSAFNIGKQGEFAERVFFLERR